MLQTRPPSSGSLAEIARVAARTCILSVPREPIWRVLNVARGAYWSALGNTPGHLDHWSRNGFLRFVGAELDVRQAASPLPGRWFLPRSGRDNVKLQGRAFRRVRWKLLFSLFSLGIGIAIGIGIDSHHEVRPSI